MGTLKKAFAKLFLQQSKRNGTENDGSEENIPEDDFTEYTCPEDNYPGDDFIEQEICRRNIPNDGFSTKWNDNFDWSFKAKCPLKVIVIGAGIAGLTAAIGLKKAGHRVVIYDEADSAFQVREEGAGLIIAPNGARILGRMGVLGEVMEKATMLQKTSLRRWKDNTELGVTPLMPAVGEKYHAPIFAIHRGDLYYTLHQRALDLGVVIIHGTKVRCADHLFANSVLLDTGKWVSADVFICADGIKSAIREQMALRSGKRKPSQPTGDAAYRIRIPKSAMKGDSKALSLLAQNVGMRWMGPNAHIMAYPIKKNTVYNMVLVHRKRDPGTDNNESWTRQGSKTEMMEIFSEWNDTVKNLLSHVPGGEVMEWTLNTHAPLDTWFHNKFALVGDACHPMVPYVGQPCAQAIEDGAALTCALSCIDSKDKVNIALKIYELTRKDRAEKIQQSGEDTRRALHLPDGDEQRARDEKIGLVYGSRNANPDLWSDFKWHEYMWGVDVMKNIISKWEKLVVWAEGHENAWFYALDALSINFD